MAASLTHKIAALAGIFMLAAGAPAMAQQPPIPQTVQQPQPKVWTPDLVRSTIATFDKLSYHDLGDQFRELRRAIYNDKALSLAAIEAIPKLLASTEDTSVWNEIIHTYDDLLQKDPLTYEPAIEKSLISFLPSYIQQSAGMTDKEFENRLYKIWIISPTPGLRVLRVENLAELLPGASLTTWRDIIRNYAALNEKYPGEHEPAISTILKPVMDALVPLLKDQHPITRLNGTYLIGNIGAASPPLAMEALQAILHMGRDTDPGVRKHAIEEMYRIAHEHKNTADTAFDEFALLAKDIATMDKDSIYHLTFGIYYLSEGSDQRTVRALTLLQDIAKVKTDYNWAVKHIGDIGRKNSSLAPQIIDILKTYMADDALAYDAAHGLNDIAVSASPFASDVIDIFTAYLVKHPDAHAIALMLADMAQENTSHADKILLTFKDMAQNGSPVFKDENLLIAILHIGTRNHAGLLPPTEEVLKLVVDTALKNGDYETLKHAAEVLGSLDSHKKRNAPAPNAPQP